MSTRREVSKECISKDTANNIDCFEMHCSPPQLTTLHTNPISIDDEIPNLRVDFPLDLPRTNHSFSKGPRCLAFFAWKHFSRIEKPP